MSSLPQFFDTCNAVRSSMVNRLREKASTIFAGIAPIFEKEQAKMNGKGVWPSSKTQQAPHIFQAHLFAREYDRSLVPIFEQLLNMSHVKDDKDATKTRKKFARWCRILYDDVDNMHGSGLFRNAALLIVSRLLHRSSQPMGNAHPFIT
jgi:hypothetical protein